VVVLITATIAGGILTRSVGALLESDWPLWLVGFIALVTTYVSWRTLKPIGTVAGLVGLSGVTRVPQAAGVALLAAVGARMGARRDQDDDDEDDDDEDEQSSTRTSRAEQYSSPPPADDLAALGPEGAMLALHAANANGGDPVEGPRPTAGPSPPRPWSASPTAAPAVVETPERDSPHEVVDMHPVVDADGREVYEVYQRAEDA
jgi:hypothetical protein